MAATKALARQRKKGSVKGVLTGHPTTARGGRNLECVDAANDIAEFLASRRARVTPEQAGLPTYGTRRVSGPAPRGGRRRWPASASSTTSAWSAARPAASPTRVLEALARALQLDDAERAHLFDLARAANPVAPKRRRAGAAARPAGRAAHPRRDRRAGDRAQQPRSTTSRANALGRALYAPVFDSREQPANSARFTFLDPAAHDFYADWERTARTSSATCAPRPAATPTTATSPTSIGELSTRSDEFRVWWAAHNVRFHRTGTKRLHHPVVGELELSYETLDARADDGLTHGALHRRARTRPRSRRWTCWPAGRPHRPDAAAAARAAHVTDGRRQLRGEHHGIPPARTHRRPGLASCASAR